MPPGQQVGRLDFRALLGLDVPKRFRVLPAMRALPLPGVAPYGTLLAPFDSDVLEVAIENMGTGNVYIKDGDRPDSLTALNSFVLGPGVAYTPAFPFSNPVWAAGDAGHDLRVSILVVDYSLKRDR